MKRVLIVVENQYEDLELWYPKIRMEEAGYHITIAGPRENQVYMGKQGLPCRADIAIDEAKSRDFDVLLIPGGYAPDKLRQIDKLLKLTAEMNQEGKIIAFICHAGWVPISAKILKGRKVTSVKSIKDDMINAGAIWSDEALVRDKNLISSRTPLDLPVFGKELATKL